MAILFQTHEGLFVGGTIVAFGLLWIVIRLTRPTPREVGLALACGWIAGFVNLVTDSLGHHLGWWSYPRVHAPFGPLIAYFLVGPAMAMLALIALRLRTLYGIRAVIALVVGFGAYGALRDHTFVAATGWIQWAPLSRHTSAEFQIRPGGWMGLADAAFEFSLPVAVATSGFLAARRFVATRASS